MSLWSCTTCAKSFARKGDLTRHKLIHTGIKPHVCETCGKGFVQLSGLKTHGNVHTHAKPYECGIGTCKKAFGDPSSRGRHRKETHSRQGAYRCIVSDCGTRIKRRSAFVTHLRKHGLDPDSIDLDVIVSQSNAREDVAPSHITALNAKNKGHHGIESRSASPSSLGDSSAYHVLGTDGEANYFVHNNGWLDDDPFDCRRVHWSPTTGALLLGPMVDQIVNVEPLGLRHDGRTDLSGNEIPFCFDGVFLTPDQPLRVVASSQTRPIIGPFMQARSDGSQSSWSSPSSTYSALYATDFNDNVVALSLANDMLQDSLLYDLM